MSVYRKNWCRKPGRGWYCTYAAEHLGRCDAWPNWWLALWWELQDALTWWEKP